MKNTRNFLSKHVSAHIIPSPQFTWNSIFLGEKSNFLTCLLKVIQNWFKFDFLIFQFATLEKIIMLRLWIIQADLGDIMTLPAFFPQCVLVICSNFVILHWTISMQLGNIIFVKDIRSLWWTCEILTWCARKAFYSEMISDELVIHSAVWFHVLFLSDN